MAETVSLRILVLNQYYPPDTSATARIGATVVEALVEAGHEVTVLAGRPSYDPTVRYSWRPLRREHRNGVTVERVGSTACSRERMLGRIANYLSYLSLALARGLFVRADAVLAMTDPPIVSVVGAMLTRFRGVPFIYNIRDLHPDMAVAAGLARPGRAVRIWDAIHRWALHSATLVIVLGEDMRRRVLAKGVDPANVVVVRDGAPYPANLPPRDHPVTREVRCGFSFVALHAGNLGFAGAWDTLLDAAARLESDGIGVVFVGGGAATDRVRERERSLANVRLLPYRPAEQVPYVLQAGDLQIVTTRRGLEGLVVPSKLYPILAAGRPVLAVATAESDTARIVAETGCGWIADPDDPEEVAERIRAAASDREELESRGRRARIAGRAYERSDLLQRFVTVMEGALTGNHRA